MIRILLSLILSSPCFADSYYTAGSIGDTSKTGTSTLGLMGGKYLTDHFAIEARAAVGGVNDITLSHYGVYARVNHQWGLLRPFAAVGAAVLSVRRSRPSYPYSVPIGSLDHVTSSRQYGAWLAGIEVDIGPRAALSIERLAFDHETIYSLGVVYRYE